MSFATRNENGRPDGTGSTSRTVRASRILRLLIFGLIVSCPAVQKSEKNMQVLSDDFELPEIIIEAEARYLCGFPTVIALTFRNDYPDTRFFDLPEMNLLGVPDSIAVQLEPLKGGAGLRTLPSPYRAGIARLTLEPGEQARMVLDLSNFGLEIQPGTYRLTLALHVSKYSRRSNPVTVEFVKPSPEDAAEAVRLRRLGISPTDTGAWGNFLKNNWNTVKVSPNISPEAAKQLALHLFLHHAFYGPTPVGRLNVEALRTITGTVLSAEVALLELEIVTARNGTFPEAMAEQTLRKWPGVRWRLKQIAEGNGLLAGGRKWFGAEKEFTKRPDSYPYQD